MSIQSDIVTALSAVASGRVYPQAAPQDAAMPFVVYRRVASEPINTIHGTIAATKSTFVFECWAADYSSALTLSDALKAAVVASALDYTNEPSAADEYEPTADSFMDPVTYGFWH